MYLYSSIDWLATIVMSKNQVLQNLQYMCQRTREFRRLVTKTNQSLLHRTHKNRMIVHKFLMDNNELYHWREFLFNRHTRDDSFIEKSRLDFQYLLPSSRNNVKTHSILMRVTEKWTKN